MWAQRLGVPGQASLLGLLLPILHFVVSLYEIGAVGTALHHIDRPVGFGIE